MLLLLLLLVVVANKVVPVLNNKFRFNRSDLLPWIRGGNYYYRWTVDWIGQLQGLIGRAEGQINNYIAKDEKLRTGAEDGEIAN